jgi:hypothetical protein
LLTYHVQIYRANGVGTTSDPDRHVVGVVNKIENGSATEQEIPATYAEFKQLFRATKAHEKAIFASYSKNGAPCDPATQCTTAAVFHHMDKITFELVHRSIEHGLKSILEKVQRTKEEIREHCAPPLAYYDCPQVAAGREVLLQDMRAVLKRLVATEFKRLHLFEHHSYDDSKNARAQREYLEKFRIHWPAECAPGDMFASQKQSEAVDGMRKALFHFVKKTALPEIERVLSDGASGCFSPVHWRFHRIDRFPKLVDALHSAILNTLPDCAETAKRAVGDYLQHLWDYEVPKGVTREQVPALLEQLKHVALRKMFEQLRALTKGDAFDALLTDNSLFEEDEEFAADRERLRLRWEHLHRQEAILETCSNVEDNEALRAALEQAYNEHRNVQHTTEEGWMEFWQEAKEEFDNRPAPARVVPPSTTLFATAQSPSQMSRGGGGASQLQPLSQSQSQGHSMGSQWASVGDLAAAGKEDGGATSSHSTQLSQSHQVPSTTAGHAENDYGIYRPSASNRTHGHAAADTRYEWLLIHEF